MLIRHQIELFMTLAFLFYLGAFWLARRVRVFHVVFALLGFSLDLYATSLMSKMREGSGISIFDSPWSIQIHTGLSYFALVLFLIVAFFGFRAGFTENDLVYSATRRRHRMIARYVFLPTWGVSFLSGFLLAF